MSEEVTPQPETERVRKVVRRKRHHRRSWWSRLRERTRSWLNSGTGFFVLLLVVAAIVVALFLWAPR